jgi:hypothetical protein
MKKHKKIFLKLRNLFSHSQATLKDEKQKCLNAPSDESYTTHKRLI